MMEKEQQFLVNLHKLLPYTDHKARCRVYRLVYMPDDQRVCDCGYWETLIDLYNIEVDLAEELGIKLPEPPLGPNVLAMMAAYKAKESQRA